MIRNKDFRKTNEVEDWCVTFVETCRSRGIRVTDQRLAVYRALSEDLTHPNAEVIFEKVSQKMPSMSLATLYRTLDFLESEGLIRKVSGTENVARFDANIAPHQHLVCRQCGNLSDMYSKAFAEMQIPVFEDFMVEELDVRFVGICKNCSKQSI